MKTSFQKFIDENHSYNGLSNNLVAKHVFENILSRDENIIAMIDCNNSGKPAICGCLQEVENYCAANATPDFNLGLSFIKQAIGRMVASILEPFGYESFSQKRIPNEFNAQYIRSAMTYAKPDNPTRKVSLKVVRTIVEV